MSENIQAAYHHQKHGNQKWQPKPCQKVIKTSNSSLIGSQFAGKVWQEPMFSYLEMRLSCMCSHPIMVQTLCGYGHGYFIDPFNRIWFDFLTAPWKNRHLLTSKTYPVHDIPLYTLYTHFFSHSIFQWYVPSWQMISPPTHHPVIMMIRWWLTYTSWWFQPLLKILYSQLGWWNSQYIDW